MVAVGAQNGHAAWARSLREPGQSIALALALALVGCHRHTFQFLVPMVQRLPLPFCAHAMYGKHAILPDQVGEPPLVTAVATPDHVIDRSRRLAPVVGADDVRA